jgi:type IV pilus assembly protein PilC
LPFLYALRIGEETGNLDGMLLKLGEELQINIEYKLKRLIKFIEPACILVLALFVGTFIISALLPIVNIMDSIN